MNMARVIDPALGGLIMAGVDAGSVFFINAISFVGVIWVLYRWQRPHRKSALPAEHVIGAKRAGLRYIRHAPAVRAVLLRTGVFIVCGSALWASLPVVVRYELGLVAVGYGGLLGAIVAGAAIASAIILPRIQRQASVDQSVAGATIVLAAATVALAYLGDLPWLSLAMITCGTAWMTLMSSFNITAQTVVPAWIRA
jgi:Transmembrane secretion effector